ncbi:hypothetical protein [Brachyspira hyodysenteriae]|uniref:hypothetical protein n=1 Tax=Brachyspira hyodysenteriae TaxID=159 RepID=UPI00063DD50E|nr:hypothetical protein [Brachyspira hyodysenteriae]KLI18270.1 hypothetical protein SU45_02960 [Brachyspira hyodysenteriae]KLI22336.1 hypothetical protein SU43_08475 [Brachyspira hyodysenteriae]KLI62696.1 hypothetical protein SZ46_00695 [Brachyspira hyodysenteriae]TVL62706.1 hypothetical protein A9X85_00520 [Brachyspira hyodysenteriae]TVL80393.1 hypothetical protein A9X82_02140 [Brachyspira hyodysenteriae]
MNKQLKKELAIIKNNNEEATKAIRELLRNDKLDVDLNRYNAEVNFNNEEIVRTDKDRDGKIISSFRVYSMRVDTNTSDDIINNYADFLELSSRMMRKEMQTKINELLGYYITKTETEIDNLKVS